MSIKRRVRLLARKFLRIDVSLFEPGRDDLIQRPTDPVGVEILLNDSFRESLVECGPYTLLDTARLANLWQICQRTDPSGQIVEVGTYKGGAALHLSNACPDREVVICDTFASFDGLPIDDDLDRIFHHGQFDDTSETAVAALFEGKQRDIKMLKGIFPNSDTSESIKRVSFAHIDVDIYESTVATLAHLESRMLPQSAIILDDYLRLADGVTKAVNEFCLAYPNWLAIPIYPGQCLMLRTH